MRWVTYDRLHLDRVATAWLIVRFVDPRAEIDFIDRSTDIHTRSDVIAFGIPGTGIGTHDARGSGFGKLLRLTRLDDAALLSMDHMVEAGVAQALGKEIPHPLSTEEETLGRALDHIGSGLGHLLADSTNLAASLPMYDAIYLDAQERLLPEAIRRSADHLSWLARRDALRPHLIPPPSLTDTETLKRVLSGIGRAQSKHGRTT